MTKEQLVDILLNITFVCMDPPDEQDVAFYNKLGVSRALRFLEDSSTRWGQSLNTKRSLQQFEDCPNFDNYHNAGHFIIVDKIIHFLRTGEGECMQYAIEHTLNCGVLSESAYNALLSLAHQSQTGAVA